MAGGFHAEHDGLIQLSDHIHELVVPSLRVGEAEGLADQVSILIDDSCFMETLGDVDTDEKHGNHLEKEVVDEGIVFSY